MLDSTPIASDWPDFPGLWAAMQQFAKDHPNHTFLCADDPGVNYQPPRIARLGWTAFRANPPEGETEDAQAWTITVANLKKTYDSSPEPSKQALQTAAGRQAMLETLR